MKAKVVVSLGTVVGLAVLSAAAFISTAGTAGASPAVGQREDMQAAICQEELEIYFMVDVGLKQLDRDSGAFDIAGALKEKIEDSYARVGRLRLLKTLGCAVRTLQVMAVAVTVLLQFRLWLWP